MDGAKSRQLHMIRDKLFRTKKTDSMKKKKPRNLEHKEERLIRLNQIAKEIKESAQKEVKEEVTNDPYRISIAVPGSLLNIAQTGQLRSYMAGQVARAATLFCVEEVVVYDETNRMTQDSIDAYWSGAWKGDIEPSDRNYESCFHLARILEYLECPQYLRKSLFGIQKQLQYAGLLNPLDSHHHLKGDDLSVSFREGVVLKKPIKEGRGPLVDIGLEKELQLEEEVSLPAGTRVTAELLNIGQSAKRYRGRLTSARKVREKTGLYWGYSVKIVPSLKDAVQNQKYDYIVATSPRGKPVSEMNVNTLNVPKVLIVFGGIQGVDAALEADETFEVSRAEEAFNFLANSLPRRGSRSERVEENILVTLSEVAMRLDQLHAKYI